MGIASNPRRRVHYTERVKNFCLFEEKSFPVIRLSLSSRYNHCDRVNLQF